MKKSLMENFIFCAMKIIASLDLKIKKPKMILNISTYQLFHIDVARMISWLGFSL